jgi:hypothetical protein
MRAEPPLRSTCVRSLILLKIGPGRSVPERRWRDAPRTRPSSHRERVRPEQTAGLLADPAIPRCSMGYGLSAADGVSKRYETASYQRLGASEAERPSAPAPSGPRESLSVVGHVEPGAVRDRIHGEASHPAMALHACLCLRSEPRRRSDAQLGDIDRRAGFRRSTTSLGLLMAISPSLSPPSAAYRGSCVKKCRDWAPRAPMREPRPSRKRDLGRERLGRQPPLGRSVAAADRDCVAATLGTGLAQAHSEFVTRLNKGDRSVRWPGARAWHRTETAIGVSGYSTKHRPCVAISAGAGIEPQTLARPSKLVHT